MVRLDAHPRMIVADNHRDDYTPGPGGISTGFLQEFPFSPDRSDVQVLLSKDLKYPTFVISGRQRGEYDHARDTNRR